MFKKQNLVIASAIFLLFILGNNFVQSKVVFQKDNKPKVLYILEFIFADNQHCLKAFSTLEGLKDVECQQILLSKVFGILIIIIASILKLPQIIKILDNKSVAGLTVTSFLFELCALGSAISVNRFKNHSLTIYGEQYLMAFQDLIILGLFFHYDKKLDKQALIIKISVLFACLAPIYLLMVPDYVYKILQLGNILIILASRVPQIRLNHKNKSTGQLSGVTLTIETFGTAIRAATILKEAAFDPLIYLSLSIAQGSILVIFIQFVKYYNSKENDKFKGNPTKTNRDRYLEQINEYKQQEQKELKELYEQQQQLLKEGKITEIQEEKEQKNNKPKDQNKKQKTD